MAQTRDQYNAYMREYAKRKGAERRLEAIKLLGGECSWCGKTEDLQFDHRDARSKSFDVAEKLWSYSWQRLLPELKKCHLLCAQCHQQKTDQERSVPHGGGVSGRRNCPCQPCKDKKKQYNKNWKIAQRIGKMIESGTYPQ